jgi:MoaA/NifB/PqqE/SkfB family radical SAM enzyme
MEGSPRREEELPVESVLRAIRECPSLGIGTLFLTGGEPLLYRRLDEVLETAANTPGLQTTVCTNGTLITSQRAAQLRAMNARVNISIDGRPEFHDRFRKQPGSFRSSERGVKAAVSAGLPVTIITTVSKANLDALEFMVHWAAEMGAEQFFAQPLLNLGRGAQIGDQCLTFDDVNRMILLLTDLANQAWTRNLRCQVIGARRTFLLQHPCGAYVCNGTGCHRGVDKEIKKIVVREDGTVLPEVPNLNHRYALGNLRDAPLSELLSRYYQERYSIWDRLCRSAYAELLPVWDCVIVPWEQIIAEKSQNWIPLDDCPSVPECASCGSSRYGTWKPGEVEKFAGPPSVGHA